MVDRPSGFSRLDPVEASLLIGKDAAEEGLDILSGNGRESLIFFRVYRGERGG